MKLVRRVVTLTATTLSLFLLQAPLTQATPIQTTSFSVATSSTFDPARIQAPTYTPADLQQAMDACDNFPYIFGDLTGRRVEEARGKKYAGGVSVYSSYSDGNACHAIVKNGRTVHGPHIKLGGAEPPVA